MKRRKSTRKSTRKVARKARKATKGLGKRVSRLESTVADHGRRLTAVERYKAAFRKGGR